MTGESTFIAKTFHGLENVLAHELELLGAEDIQKQNRAVSFKGDETLMYKSNLWLRTALNVLVPVKSFKADNRDVLYKETSKINWTGFITPKNTFAIEAIVHTKNFNHSNFPALVIKDAIVDQIRRKYKLRPSIDKHNPDYRITAYFSNNDVSILLNSSGAPLFKRGYRQRADIAPINEVLAAGMIDISGWKGKQPFYDPMCGSGTIAIEAAMKALNVAPGLLRREFGFMKWKKFDKLLWDKLLKDAEAQKKSFVPHIYGSDISPDAVRIAKQNIKKSGFESFIEIKTHDFSNFEPAEKEGLIVTNPPYGERIKLEDIMFLYGMIGNTLKNKCAGYTAWIISSNMDAFKYVGLRHTDNLTLYNGKLECRFRKYEMYAGSRKK